MTMTMMMMMMMMMVMVMVMVMMMMMMVMMMMMMLLMRMRMMMRGRWWCGCWGGGGGRRCWGWGGWCWGGRPIPRPGCRLCASLRSWNAHAHCTRRKFTGKMPDANPGASILWEPAQSKCTWTCHKRHFVRKFTGKMPDANPAESILCEPAQSKRTWTFTRAVLYGLLKGKCMKMPNAPDTTSIEHLNTYRKKPCVATLFGKKRLCSVSVSSHALWQRSIRAFGNSPTHSNTYTCIWTCSDGLFDRESTSESRSNLMPQSVQPILITNMCQLLGVQGQEAMEVQKAEKAEEPWQ